MLRIDDIHGFAVMFTGLYWGRRLGISSAEGGISSRVSVHLITEGV